MERSKWNGCPHIWSMIFQPAIKEGTTRQKQSYAAKKCGELRWIAVNCGECGKLQQIAGNCGELAILCLENFSAPQMNCGKLRWMRQICGSLLRKIFSAAKLQQFSDGLRQIAANWGELRRFAVICGKSSIICSKHTKKLKKPKRVGSYICDRMDDVWYGKPRWVQVS